MGELETLHQDLVTEWTSKGRSMGKVGGLLTRLKMVLSEMGLLIPDSTTVNADSVGSLLIAKEVLELGALYSIRTNSIPAFDRYTSLLNPFYTDLEGMLQGHGREDRRPILTSLILLNLLAQNKIANFHILLENLPEHLIKTVEVQHPVRIEQWLMEGNYGKVWASREQVPCEESMFFVDSLMGTIRNEIASCEEKAYDSLPLNNAATLLFFTTMQDMLTFAQTRGWTVNSSQQRVYFNQKVQGQASTKSRSLMEDNLTAILPIEDIIRQNLRYAADLEAIV